jgi:hypothetical protein
VLLLLSAIAAAVPLLFVFVFCGEWADGGRKKKKGEELSIYLPGCFSDNI